MPKLSWNHAAWGCRIALNGAEDYTIEQTSNAVFVVRRRAHGAMYGGQWVGEARDLADAMEVAERDAQDRRSIHGRGRG
jgi:hypothetical protein